MALNNAVLSWNANTEPDFLQYKIYASQSLNTAGVPDQTIPSAFTSTITGSPTITFTAGSFDRDGLWYFAVSALDTTGNESAPCTAQSKRIIRVSNNLIRRK